MGCCFGKPAPENVQDERSHFSKEALKKPLNSPPVIRKPPENVQAERSHFSEEAVKKPLNSPPPVITRPAPPERVQGEKSHFSEEKVKDPIFREEEVKKPLNSPPPSEEKVKDQKVKDPISSKEKSHTQKNPTGDSGAIFSDKNNFTEKKSTDDSSTNSFLLPARELSITWGDDKRYWQWMLSGGVDVAELLEVCWFDVQGKFETRKLPPGTTYQVFFLVMLKKGASGFKDPVNLRLVLPDGQKQEGKESLMNLKKDEWIELQVGEFYMSSKVGQIQFSMFEHSNQWKTGLAVKGVVIRPKK